MFTDHKCEECGKKDDEVGTLEIHRIKQGGTYNLRNVKVVCHRCHGFFSSAQNKAWRITS